MARKTLWGIEFRKQVFGKEDLEHPKYLQLGLDDIGVFTTSQLAFKYLKEKLKKYYEKWNHDFDEEKLLCTVSDIYSNTGEKIVIDFIVREVPLFDGTET